MHYIYKVEYIPFNPMDYVGLNSFDTPLLLHTCVRAVIDYTEQNPIIGVLAHKEMAQKNMNVIHISGDGGPGVVSVGVVVTTPDDVFPAPEEEVIFETIELDIFPIPESEDDDYGVQANDILVSTQSDDNTNDNGNSSTANDDEVNDDSDSIVEDILAETDIIILMDDDIYDPWVDNGGQGNDITDLGDNQVMVSGPNPSIDNIPCTVGVKYVMQLLVNTSTAGFQPFVIDVTQSDIYTKHCLKGGVRYAFINQNNSNPIETDDVTYRESSLELNEGISVAPNPTEGIFTLQTYDKEMTNIIVMTPSGETVRSIKVSSATEIKVDLDGLHQGLYIIRAQCLDGTSLMTKILKY